MSKKIILLGGGGHASVLADLLVSQGQKISYIVAEEINPFLSALSDTVILNSDLDVLAYSSSEVELVNGLGSLPGNNVRRKVYTFFKEKGYAFKTVVHSSAVVSKFATLSEGAQVMANSTIQALAVIGENSIINTSATVDHDCIIGIQNHIAPGVTLSGGVITGEGVHVGTGANVIQGLEIGNFAVIGAGATVVKNVSAGTTIIGSSKSVARTNV